MEEETNKSRRMTSRSELFQIYELLKKVGKTEGEYYVYSDGWDDIAVAKAVSPGLTKWPVKDVRESSFGKLRQFKKDKLQYGNLHKRIDDLEALYLKLLERIEHLPF